jgi:hypothetical protein
LPGVALDETPALPPNVTGQMGGGQEKTPFSGVGAMLNKQQPARPAGGADPSGQIKNSAETITRVIDNMATMSPVGAPFAARIKEMLNQWVAEAAKAGPGGGGKPPDISAKPPEGGTPADFTG